MARSDAIMKKLLGLIFLGAISAQAQQLPQLPRATSGEVDDSTLALISIANPFRTRAVSLGILKTKVGASPDSLRSDLFRITGTGTRTIATESTGATVRRIQFNTSNTGGGKVALRLNESGQVLGGGASAAANPTFAIAGDSTNGFSSFTGGVGTMGWYNGGSERWRFTNTTFGNPAGITLGSGPGSTITGGAGNMTIQAGTGNSRTMTLQTTTSAGTAKNTLVLGADSSATTLGSLNVGGDTIASVGDNMILTANGTSKGLRLFATNSGGTQVQMADIVGGASPRFDVNQRFYVNTTSATNTESAPGISIGNSNNNGMYFVDNGTVDTLGFSVNGVASFKAIRDTLIVHSKMKAMGLTTEPSTQSALCVNNGGGQVYINAAATCTVSSRRFKEDIRPLGAAWALGSVMDLHPSTFRYINGKTKAIGLIAEDVVKVDPRLVSYDPQGRPNSVNYEQVTVMLLSVVQQQQMMIQRQQAQIDSIRAQIKKP